MTNEIRDLDDVEAQAWVSVCARLGTRHADECVRLLRERRATTHAREASAVAVEDCAQDRVCATPPGCLRHWAERCRELVRERDAAAVTERAKVAAWLRSHGAAYSGSLSAQFAEAIERGDHDRGPC